MKFIETVKKMLPGCVIALVIAVVAKFLEQLEESGVRHLLARTTSRSPACPIDIRVTSP